MRAIKKRIGSSFRPRRTRWAAALFVSLFAAALMAPSPLPKRSFTGPGSNPPVAVNKSRNDLRAVLVNLPLGFEPGWQENEFHARGDGLDLYLTASRLVLRSANRDPNIGAGETVALTLLRANDRAQGTAFQLLPGKSNYLIGNDRTQWRTDVSRFAKVRYDEVYPGIDLVYYGNQQRLEYDFVVQPGNDPGAIALSFDAAARIQISPEGELVADTVIGEVRQPKPFIYQDVDGERTRIDGNYVLNAEREIGFEVAAYDHSKPLVIDPTLVYSSYLGGAGDDSGSSIAVDSYNNIYVTGTTSSPAFPTKNAFRSASAGLSDIFVTRIDASGGGLVYSTYIGGSGLDRGDGIAVDQNGRAYVVGRVDSSSINFPTTAGAFATTYRGGDFDAVVFKLNAQGNNLVYSNFLGGEENDSAVGIAVDAAGNAFVTGGTRSTGFPTTATAYQPTRSGDTDAYLARFNASGSGLMYSTFIGGGGTDRSSGVAIDSSGNAYIDGYTSSMDFPTQNAFQNSSGGSFDVFVAKLDTAGNGAGSLVFCSFLGGTGDDKAYGMAIDGDGSNLYLVGQSSSNNFPVLNPAQATNGGNFDAFIAKVSSAGAKVYATYLGGAGDDRGIGIAVNAAGQAYLTGFTSSTNFPTVNPLQPTNGGGIDAFVAKLNSAGGAFLYATYLGGSGVENSASTITSTNPISLDASSNAYLTGYTASANFPVSSPLQSSNAGSQDAFIAKISDGDPASLQFSSSSFSANEGDGFVKISVTRTGNTATAVDIDYATSNASASSRTDYTLTSGTLHFAAGEVLKKFSISLVDDVYVEGNETVTMTLKKPQGGGAFVGTPGLATLTISDNDASPANFNPLDVVAFFVRQHYLDFLHREPDPDGLTYWMNEITKCGNDAACVNDRRIGVSASFFVSAEFQESGAFVYRLYRGTLGRDPTYAEFSADRSKLIGGLDLEANKGVLVHDFMGRPAFADKYSDGPTFITTLAETARTASGAALPNLTSDLTQSYNDCLTSKSPLVCKELIVAQLVEYPDFAAAVYNRSFVIMEYFGYLRRDPDADGYTFWLDVLNNREPNNYRGMVCSFITSAEYQQRFSPVITRTNAECSGVQ